MLECFSFQMREVGREDARAGSEAPWLGVSPEQDPSPTYSTYGLRLQRMPGIHYPTYALRPAPDLLSTSTTSGTPTKFPGAQLVASPISSYPSFSFFTGSSAVTDSSFSFSSIIGLPLRDGERFIPSNQDIAIRAARARIAGDEQDGPVAEMQDGDLAWTISEDGRDLVEVLVTKRYKKVANRTVPVSATLPEDFRIERRRPKDLLIDLSPMPGYPPEFEPGERYTQARHDEFPIDPRQFLTPSETRLAEWIVRVNEEAFAWNEDERGSFDSRYFDPIRVPTMPHTPWVLKNIPIPHGIYTKVCDIIKTKIDANVYEPSNSSYRSRWFCVSKKDGVSLRLVHDLRPLNEVAIRDVAALPFIDEIVERAAGKACYTGLDLLVAFDQRALHPDSRDFTTFQTPYGAHRLTAIPMGYTNSVAILQGDVSFIFQPEMPHIVNPFADDCNMNGPSSRYETADGDVERCPWNSDIRRFIWEHFANVHRCLHTMKRFGGTFSGKKLYFCVPELEILGHTVHYGGKSADKLKVQKIADWPPCRSLTEVRAFLGTCGLVRTYVKGFSLIARPLVELTKKEVPFEWGPRQMQAMETVKQAVIASPALCAIRYDTDLEVILAVDSSYIAVGFILYQLSDEGKRRPARFGSITWNERESRYSQAKIELYGVYRAMRAWRLYIIGVRSLVVEVDAMYIKDMLNNPDLVPSAAINRWIAGILLFTFTLRHVPGTQHGATDGMSRRPRSDDDPAEDGDEAEDFIDNSYAFFMERTNLVDPLPIRANEPFGRASCVPSGTVQVLGIAELEGKLPERSERVKKQDAKVGWVYDFLRGLKVPEGLSKSQANEIARMATQFFVDEGELYKRNPGGNGKHKLYIPKDRRFGLVRQAHDDLGHKGRFAVRLRLAVRFWWPGMDNDVAWYLRTCHACQTRNSMKYFAPPIPMEPSLLFHRWHIDTMMLPTSNGKRHCVHAREGLVSWPEARGMRNENHKVLAAFMFEILCRWGAALEFVTDNGPAFVKAAAWLHDHYHVLNIRISSYNSQANGAVERRHRDLREVLVKMLGAECKGWDEALPAVLWAERSTTVKSTGLSPYQMVTGQEPLLPFDLTEATWLVHEQDQMSTPELLALRARALQKREEDLAEIGRRIKKSRLGSIAAWEKLHKSHIVDFHCTPGDLVLIRNKRVEMEMDRKTKPRYYGPMVVVSRGRNGAYTLGELDGSLSRNTYAAARIIPYYPRTHVSGTYTADTGATIDIPDVAAAMRAVMTTDPPIPDQHNDSGHAADDEREEVDIDDAPLLTEEDLELHDWPTPQEGRQEDSNSDESDEPMESDSDEEATGPRRSTRLAAQLRPDTPDGAPDRQRGPTTRS